MNFYFETIRRRKWFVLTMWRSQSIKKNHYFVASQTSVWIPILLHVPNSVATCWRNNVLKNVWIWNTQFIFFASFVHYFSEQRIDVLKKKHQINDQFSFETLKSIMELNVESEQGNELLYLICDKSLRIRHKSVTLSSFWIRISNEYSLLSKISVLLLLLLWQVTFVKLDFSIPKKLAKEPNNSTVLLIYSIVIVWTKISQTNNTLAHQSHWTDTF